MGDAADDMFDLGLREQDKLWTLLRACPRQAPCNDCRWERVDDETDEADGMLRCSTCNMVVDE